MLLPSLEFWQIQKYYWYYNFLQIILNVNPDMENISEYCFNINIFLNYIDISLYKNTKLCGF